MHKPYPPFHAEFGIRSEFDFGDFVPRDDLPLCDVKDHSLSLPTISIQFSKAITRTCDMIDRSLAISSSEQICDSMFVMAQHTRRARICHINGD
jgi:hypothetical protein